MNTNFTYRGFDVHRREVPKSDQCVDRGTGMGQPVEYTIVYGESFPDHLRGCAVLSTAGYRTWMQAEEAIDMLHAAGFDPKTGQQGDVYEFFAMGRELAFRRAYAANRYLPKDRKFRRVQFTVKSFTPSIVRKGNDPMVNMPEYDKAMKSPQCTFSIPIERWPKRLRQFVKRGAVFSCIANTDTVDHMFGDIRLVKQA